MQRIIKSLRSITTEMEYQKFIKNSNYPKCFLCRAKSIIEFKHWKIVENQYPYDDVAIISHILTTKNHKRENDFSEKERVELIKIKREFAEKYDMTIENNQKNQSIPQHYHLHLLVIKEREVEII